MERVTGLARSRFFMAKAVSMHCTYTQREIDRHRHRHRHTHTHRDTHRERYTHTHTHRSHRYTHTQIATGVRLDAHCTCASSVLAPCASLVPRSP
eukprot:3941716-Rhodomonas_salina.3